MTPRCEQAVSFLRVSHITHGFFTRDGGVSATPYASLNCGFSVKDQPTHVQKNRERVLASLGLSTYALVVPSLAHGDHAIIVDDDTDLEGISLIKADAVITTRSRIVIGVTYADCLPVLLVDEAGEIVAVIHAGWRGVVANIIGKTIATMSRLITPKNLMCAIGPAISCRGFEVSNETIDQFLQLAPQFVHEQNRRYFVDLVAIATKQVRDTGVNSIEKVGGFTDLDETRYFSHRRDQGHTGRHLALIAKKS